MQDLSTSSVFNVLKNGKTGKSFDVDIRKFAQTLHFYSPRAYRYVREHFENRLPSTRSIQKWYEGINGEPGITFEAITAIGKKTAEEKNNGKLFNGYLMFDEMAIRTNLDWDKFLRRSV